MDLDRRPSQIAYAAGEQIRELNHATLKPRAYRYPSQAASTALALAEGLQRLPQSFDQLERGLTALVQAGGVTVPGAPVSAGALAAEVTAELSEAKAALERCVHHLRQASESASGLSGSYPDDIDDEEDSYA